MGQSDAAGTSLTVTWAASTDTGGPGIGGYYIFRNGNTTTPIAAVSSGTSYTDSILVPGTAYTYAIVAFDQSAPRSITSALSATLDVSTLGATPPNALAVIVDAGPASLANANEIAANTLFATVTLCSPNTNACQQIDHIQVDTGSTGLLIMSEVLNGTAALPALNDTVSGNPLRECIQFADGYSWGSLKVADVQIGGRSLPSLPVLLVGDPAAGTAPAGCVLPNAENTVAAFGANGVLGINGFLQDCGAACANGAVPAEYYQCPGGQCVPTAVPLIKQLQNPLGVAALAPDNTGVVIELPAVASSSEFSLSGVLHFGLGTLANNTPGGAVQFFTVDGSGTLFTSYGAFVKQAGSIIDSGSNAYFFTSSLPVCTHSYDSSFYCPTTMATPEVGTIQGATGAATTTVNYSVDSADQLFANYGTAFPNLAGPNNVSGTGPVSSFDWGLPFFFNRTVYVLFENGASGGTNGPAVGF